MITQEPAVGKILLRQSSSATLAVWPEEGGPITRVAGKRVYYLHKDKETFTLQWYAICSVQAEADELLNCAAMAKEKVLSLRSEILSDLQRIIDRKPSRASVDADAALLRLHGSTEPKADEPAPVTARVRRVR